MACGHKVRLRGLSRCADKAHIRPAEIGNSQFQEVAQAVQITWSQVVIQQPQVARADRNWQVEPRRRRLRKPVYISDAALPGVVEQPHDLAGGDSLRSLGARRPDGETERQPRPRLPLSRQVEDVRLAPACDGAPQVALAQGDVAY